MNGALYLRLRRNLLRSHRESVWCTWWAYWRIVCVLSPLLTDNYIDIVEQWRPQADAQFWQIVISSTQQFWARAEQTLCILNRLDGRCVLPVLASLVELFSFCWLLTSIREKVKFMKSQIFTSLQDRMWGEGVRQEGKGLFNIDWEDYKT